MAATRKPAAKAVAKPAAPKKARKPDPRLKLKPNLVQNGSHRQADRNAEGCLPAEHAFVLEFLVDKNGTQAAIRAGYSPPGAHVMAYKLMKRPHVRAAIDKRLAALAEKIEATAERTLLELARVAFFDIRKLYHEDGKLKAIHELDADAAAAVASIERVGGAVAKLKAHSKVPALDALAKHFGLFKEDNKQKGDAIAALLEAVNERGTGLPVKP